jgi:hypothetical protein
MMFAMLWMALAVSAAAAIYLGTVYGILRRLASAPLSWRLLGWSGVPLAFSGLGFATRFWNPTPGPYIANKVYPFGGHLQAWAVSFGFTWMALALLFSGAVLLVWQNPGRRSWSLLLASWLLCLWPHVIIAIAFAWNGANQESVRFYGRWWSTNPFGPIVLMRSTLMILWHFSFALIGFIGTGRRIFS